MSQNFFQFVFNLIIDKTFQLRVQASDGGTPSKSVINTFKITINRNLKTPTWKGDTSILRRIEEKTVVGTVLANFSAIDEDRIAPYNQITFSLDSGGNGGECFGVNSRNGEVFLKKSLLIEPCSNRDQFNVRIKLSDGGSPPKVVSSRATFSARIARNKYKPVFTRNGQYKVTIKETATPDRSITTVTANDRDNDSPYKDVTYSLTGKDNAVRYFSVNSTDGRIILSRSLQNDLSMEYELEIEASDGDSSKSFASLVVNVERNLHKPIFTQISQSVTIYEWQTLGETIAKVKAEDADTKSPHKDIIYEIVGTNNAREYFGIDEIRGEIFVKKPLTRDSSDTSNYQVEVSAKDLGNPQLRSNRRAVVSVQVRRNRNCPRFSGSFSSTINYTLSTNSFIFKIEANDNDPIGTPMKRLTYTLEGNSKARNYFRVESDTGNVNVRNNLRNDQNLEYKLWIKVADNAQPPCETQQIYTIFVRRNLFSPVFTQNQYTVTIKEEHPRSQEIITVRATDRDEIELYKTVNYYLASNSPYQELFRIDRNSGAIFLASSLIGINGEEFTVRNAS